MSAYEGSYMQEQAEQAAEERKRFDAMTPAQKAARLGVPLIPARKALPVVDSNPVVAICGACGIELRKIMHMACQRSDCPTREAW